MDLIGIIGKPAMLKGEKQEVKILDDEGKEASWIPSFSRIIVAGFLIAACERDEWVRRIPVICN